ncbi:MAG: hypothetical protein Q8K45_15680 [Rubrivivax sp.]|nr:hypothetical protein [Rubrivivax sp.]
MHIPRTAKACLAIASFWACTTAQAVAADPLPLPATLVATPTKAQPLLAAAALELQLLAGRRVADVVGFAAEAGTRRLHFSVREDTTAERVGVALTRTLQLADLRSNAPALLQLGTAFSRHQRFLRGDTIVFEQQPGQALRLFINGTPAAEALGDASLMNVLARAWVAPAAVALRQPAGR